ncbi:MAG: DUF2066 domain-containing protein [Pseudomonadota bacterium]
MRKSALFSFLAFLLLLASVLSGHPLGGTAAVAQEVFAVKGVAVDKTAQSASQAREAAIAQGQQIAFQRLVQKLVPDYEWSRVPNLTADEIAPLVLDFSVSNERTSSVRYLADLTFRFRPSEVRAKLRQSGVSFAVTESKPVLVLPIYSEGGQDFLWGAFNPWFETWALRREDNGLVPFIVPLGDLEDIAVIDSRGALEADSQSIERFGERYGTEDVLVTYAAFSGDLALGDAELQIITWPGADVTQSATDRFSQGPDDTLETLLARAADGIAYRIEENWKQQNLLEYGNQRSLPIWILSQDLASFLEIRDRMKGVASIEGIKVSRLSKSWSLLQVSFVGDESKLSIALDQQDLRLALSPDNEWLLSRSEDDAPLRRIESDDVPLSDNEPGSLLDDGPNEGDEGAPIEFEALDEESSVLYPSEQ